MPVIKGTAGNDFDMHGTAGHDVLYGYAGEDTLYGEAGDDILFGGEGSDIIYGDDPLSTVVGNDVIYGGGGNDILIGGQGDDTYVVDYGMDFIYDSAGKDEIHFTRGSIDDLTVTQNFDVLEMRFGAANFGAWIWSPPAGTTINVETVELADGFRVDLNTFRAWQWGAGGNDVIHGGTAADVIIGRAGDDTLNGFGGNDTIHGGSGNDTLYGGSGNDLLVGGDGNDRLYGGDDGDTLIGGLGADRLFGGAGSDVFKFVQPDPGAVDYIADFNRTEDKLDLSALLSKFDPLTDAIADFVRITDNGRNSVVSVDVDGKGTAHGMVDIAVIGNVNGLTDEQALLKQGVLVA